MQALDAKQVALIASAGNAPTKEQGLNVEPPMNRYPALFSKDGAIPNLIVAGSTDQFGRRALSSRGGSNEVIYAPGKDLILPVPGGTMRIGGGTSYGKLILTTCYCSHQITDNGCFS